jgi:hypothetical protein
MRRALYCGTVVMWAASAGLATHAAMSESFVTRTVLLFVVALAGSLSTASLFAAFVVPLERVYRHGYEAGQHACQEYRPGLRMVKGQRN